MTEAQQIQSYRSRKFGWATIAKITGISEPDLRTRYDHTFAGRAEYLTLEKQALAKTINRLQEEISNREILIADGRARIAEINGLLNGRTAFTPYPEDVREVSA